MEINKICICVGDWSDDGHGETVDYWIETYFTDKKIKKAYQAGTAKLSFDLTEDVCRNYEDYHLTEEVLEELRGAGFTEEVDADFLGTDSFFNIYTFICKLGNPDFSFIQIKPVYINIGGYGLF